MLARIDQRHHFRIAIGDSSSIGRRWPTVPVMEDDHLSRSKVVALIIRATSRFGSTRIQAGPVEPLLRLRLACNNRVQHGWQRIVKRQGYIPPKPMTSLLQAIIDDPSPGPSLRRRAARALTRTAIWTEAERDGLAPKSSFIATIIKIRAGAQPISISISDIIEYCRAETMARRSRTLTHGPGNSRRATPMIDRFGAAFINIRRWRLKHPHFEKIMQMQAESLRT